MFDADQEDGLELLAAVQRARAKKGIPSYLELSRRGAHLSVFFDTPAPVLIATLRRVYSFAEARQFVEARLL